MPREEGRVDRLGGQRRLAQRTGFRIEVEPIDAPARAVGVGAHVEGDRPGRPEPRIPEAYRDFRRLLARHASRRRQPVQRAGWKGVAICRGSETPARHALDCSADAFQEAGIVAACVTDPARIDFDLPGTHHYRAAFPLDGRWGFSLVPITVINGLRADAEAGSRHASPAESCGGRGRLRRHARQRIRGTDRGQAAVPRSRSRGDVRPRHPDAAAERIGVRRAHAHVARRRRQHEPRVPRQPARHAVLPHRPFRQDAGLPARPRGDRPARGRTRGLLPAVHVAPPDSRSRAARRDDRGRAAVRHAVRLRLRAIDGVGPADRRSRRRRQDRRRRRVRIR